MDVSVIIPTFNRPDLLKQTLESVLGQKEPVRETIVVDNGTNDETGSMVDAAFGSAVTVLKVPPEGVQAARNAGIERAKGEWIATLDDDDLWHAEYIENVSLAATDARADLIYSDFRKFNDDGRSREAYPQTNFEMAPAGYWDDVPRPVDGLRSSFAAPSRRAAPTLRRFYPSAMAVRRDFVKTIGGFNREIHGIKSEDMEFTLGRCSADSWRSSGRHSWTIAFTGKILRRRLGEQAIGRWKILEYDPGARRVWQRASS